MQRAGVIVHGAEIRRRIDRHPGRAQQRAVLLQAVPLERLGRVVHDGLAVRRAVGQQIMPRAVALEHLAVKRHSRLCGEAEAGRDREPVSVLASHKRAAREQVVQRTDQLNIRVEIKPAVLI